MRLSLASARLPRGRAAQALAFGAMERVVVVGNCQATALAMMLRTNDEFTARFELVDFPAVHEIPAAMVPELHRAVAEAAVVIPQRIDDGYRDGLGLGTETMIGLARTSRIVRWPSVYWAGYFPDLFYLRDAAGTPVVDGPFDYHDRSILDAYAAGLDVAATCDLLADPELPSDACAWAASATAELELRGADCDVGVGDFIGGRFREELLLLTMNHPSNATLGFLAEAITGLLGIPGRVDPRRFAGEILGPSFYPVHANHARALELAFAPAGVAGDAPFRIRGVVHSPAAAVRAFFAYYTANPRLVELNLERPAAGKR